ncbi:hypothetical protein BMR02_14840 [Methylococcaceae bacterium HT1]|uniref:hypothetical protein n=1 Tax=Bathymodiolus platifrons methanotrophic gill symbiont TaxID=113268 RepID=UPI0011C73381|nr:hypothetical protein [Bathymodiolus platifrons methanotrophic gill symbiont]TXK93707.1 hypothetical protein BMR02_14840 [Methylococcaceae bacterium HT1]TXL16068.1 hypothetical protein BMR06_15910 [Methylococcaceae bacterium HT5]
MNNIPLVRVRYAGSFAKELHKLGAPTERVLNTVGLSEEILDIPDGFMPVEQLSLKIRETELKRSDDF